MYTDRRNCMSVCKHKIIIKVTPDLNNHVVQSRCFRIFKQLKLFQGKVITMLSTIKSTLCLLNMINICMTV